MITILYVLGIALLIGAPVKQAMILWGSAANDGDRDTKIAFFFHGLASLGASIAWRVPHAETFTAVCFVLIGLVSSWIYWIRPLYKKNP
jgi:hypothetical protein